MYQHSIDTLRDYLEHNRKLAEAHAHREFRHLSEEYTHIVQRAAADYRSVADMLENELSQDMTDERWFFVNEVAVALHNSAFRRLSTLTTKAVQADAALDKMKALDQEKEDL